MSFSNHPRATATVAGVNADTWVVDVPASHVITWEGKRWTVRPMMDSQGPGPNAWSNGLDAAFVDANGYLNLSMHKDAKGIWRAVELEGPHLGYGQYTWVVDTDPNGWDIEPVLGLFTYDDGDNGTAAYREIDIEFSKWNFAPEPSRNWFSVQPVSETINGVNVVNEYLTSDHAVSSATPYTLSFIWEPGQVYFRAVDANGLLLGEHVVTERVPVPSTETTRMNLWLIEGRAPSTANDVTVVLRGFTHTPGVTHTRPAASTISMDFTYGVEGFAMKTSGTPGGPLSHITDYQLALECNGADYSVAYSGSVFNLTGSSVDIRVNGLPLGGNYTQEALYMLRYDQHNYFSIFFSAGGMYGRVRENGVNRDVFLANEDLWNGQRYWRIREAAGSVYFEFSGNRTTWTQVGTLTHTYGNKLKSLRVRFECGYYGTETASPPFLIGAINKA